MTVSERAREWRLKNPERYRKTLQKWRAKNPAYMKAYRQKNRELIAEQMRVWRMNNPDKITSQQKRWRADNPEKVTAQQQRFKSKNRKKLSKQSQQWRKKNPEKYAEQLKRWHSNNPTKRARYSVTRRARKHAATIGNLTDIAKIYDRRDWWRQWFDVQVDHIISLARGGTHEPSNLQIIYDFENRRKHAKPDYKPKVVFV